jgi:hypothetical protein
MRVLTATSRTQGERSSDFDDCSDGELVTVGVVCAGEGADPDGGCGCARAFTGLNSHRTTTTAMVREVELSMADYVEALRSSLSQQGWPTADVSELAEWLPQLVSEWPEGTVVERRFDDLVARHSSLHATSG